MSVDVTPLKNMEVLSDREVLALRAQNWNVPTHREMADAELLRRQLHKQTRATKFAAVAAVAAAITALVNLFLALARILGWLP